MCCIGKRIPHECYLPSINRGYWNKGLYSINTINWILERDTNLYFLSCIKIDISISICGILSPRRMDSNDTFLLSSWTAWTLLAPLSSSWWPIYTLRIWATTTNESDNTFENTYSITLSQCSIFPRNKATAFSSLHFYQENHSSCSIPLQVPQFTKAPCRDCCLRVSRTLCQQTCWGQCMHPSNEWGHGKIIYDDISVS